MDIGRVRQLALLGLSNKEIAAAFGVPAEEFEVRASLDPTVRAALENGRLFADGEAAEALHKRALGYDVIETKLDKDGREVETTRHYPPDTAAATRWLAQKRPETWKEQKGIEHSGAITFDQAVRELNGDN